MRTSAPDFYLTTLHSALCTLHYSNRLSVTIWSRNKCFNYANQLQVSSLRSQVSILKSLLHGDRSIPTIDLPYDPLIQSINRTQSNSSIQSIQPNRQFSEICIRPIVTGNTQHPIPRPATRLDSTRISNLDFDLNVYCNP